MSRHYFMMIVIDNVTGEVEDVVKETPVKRENVESA